MTTKKRYIATLDIETLDGLRGKKFAVGCFFTIQNGKKAYIIEKDYKLFFKEIFDFSKEHKTLCFIQNQDFDIRFIIKFCIDNYNIYPFVIQSNSSILEVRIPEFNIVFRDSLQFLLCGQTTAEKTFLKKQIKKEVDFDKLLKKLNSKKVKKEIKDKLWVELEERVKSDVEGLYKLMFKYQELMFKKFGLNIFNFVTLPSFVIRTFIKRLREDRKIKLIHLNPYLIFQNFTYKWKNQKTKDLYYWTRKSYFGGRCEVFNFNYLNKVYYYDFNSLYPSCCISKKYPTANNFFMLDYPSNKFFFDNIKKKYLYIIEAKVKENILYPILPIRDKESVKFVNGEKIGVWVSPIFERFLEFEENNIIEIIKIRVYEESEYYFKDFMSDRYYNRTKYKKENDNPNVEIEKLVMNSLTGKPAQKPVRHSWVLYNEEIYNNMLYDNSQIEIIEFTEKYKLIKVYNEVLKDFQLIEWTSFITGYAQEYLHRTIYKLKEQNIDVYYCDTDCLFTSHPLEKNIELIDLIGEDIMQLKNELIKVKDFTLNRKNGNYINNKTLEEIQPPFFDEIKFYLPKVYVLKKEENFQIVAKGISLFMLYETLGIPLNKNSENKDLFNEKIKSFKQAEYLLFSTGVYTHRYLKYKSSLRQNKDLLSSAKIEKTIKKIYDKRRIKEDLTTVPLLFSELTELKKVRTENLNTLLNNNKMSYVAYTISNSERNKKIKRF